MILPVEDLPKALRAAADPTRLRLLAVCARSELTVSELVRVIAQSQPRISRHLRVLCEAGLLERIREGNWVFHRLTLRGNAAAAAAHLVDLIPMGQAPFSLDIESLDIIRAERDRAAAAYFRDNARAWNEIRSLHADDGEVEKAVLDMLPDTGLEEYLDIGTGTGRILELMAGRVGHGQGIDLSHEMLAIARASLDKSKLANCRVRHGDMYRLPFADASFDAVTIHQVLHYADSPDRAIAEAARVLRPGGRLLVVDFAPHQHDELRAEHNHRRLGFSDSEVSGWCAKAGLDNRAQRHLPGGPLTVALWLAERSAIGPGVAAGEYQHDEK